MATPSLLSTIGKITVGTSQKQLTADTRELSRGIRIAVTTNTAVVYWGPTGVTTATGYPVSKVTGESQISPGDFYSLSDIYLISDTGSTDVRVVIVNQSGVTLTP